jgi:hypothetical protein
LTVRPGNHDLGIAGNRDRRELSGWIRMCQTAADRAPVSNLVMGDMLYRLG